MCELKNSMLHATWADLKSNVVSKRALLDRLGPHLFPRSTLVEMKDKPLAFVLDKMEGALRATGLAGGGGVQQAQFETFIAYATFIIDKALPHFQDERTRTHVWREMVLRNHEAFHTSPEKYLGGLVSALLLDFAQVTNDIQLRTFIRQHFSAWFEAVTREMARTQLGEDFLNADKLSEIFRAPSDLEARWIHGLVSDLPPKQARLLHFSDLAYVTRSEDILERWNAHMEGHSVATERLPRIGAEEAS